MSCARTSIGIALSEEDVRYCSELISKIIAEKMEEILAAFELIGEAASIAFNIGLQGWAEACKTLQAAFGEIEDAEKVRNVSEKTSVQLRQPLPLHSQSAQKPALHETGVLIHQPTHTK